jgi:hypothetical protein
MWVKEAVARLLEVVDGDDSIQQGMVVAVLLK